MYVDRQLVKYHAVKLRFDDYEQQKIDKLVNKLGGHKAEILHDLLINALNNSISSNVITEETKLKRA